MVVQRKGGPGKASNNSGSKKNGEHRDAKWLMTGSLLLHAGPEEVPGAGYMPGPCPNPGDQDTKYAPPVLGAAFLYSGVLRRL